MVAGGGGGVVVGVVGERDDDLFKATRGPHGTSSAGASFLHLFSARLLPLSFFLSLFSLLSRQESESHGRGSEVVIVCRASASAGAVNALPTTRDPGLG